MLLEIQKTLTSIININFRKENHGKEEVLAADVKFTMTLPISLLHDLAVDQPPIPFSEFFYDDPVAVESSTVEGETYSRKRELGIGGISLSTQLFSHELQIQSDGEHMPPIDFSDVKINNLSVAFEDNRQMKLTGRFQFEVPEDDELIGRLAEFIKSDAKVTITPPKQMDLIDNAEESNVVDFEEGGTDEDPMYEQAKELVINSQRATISSLQRELKIGYNRATRLIERMEAEGVVGPHQDNAPREILIQPDANAAAEEDAL